MNSLSHAPIVAALWALAALSSCERKRSTTGESSEPHLDWLEACDDDATCGGLSCLCGRCTAPCEDAAECARFDPRATCEQLPNAPCATQTVCLLPNAVASDATGSVAQSSAHSVAHSDAVSSSRTATGDASAASEQASSNNPDASDVTSAKPATESNETSGSSTVEATSTADGCAHSEPGTACPAEGVICGECSNPCQFCNLLRCADGVWRAMEVFPAPCTACGEALQCNTLDSYCHLTDDTTYSCESYPAACNDDHSCECLEAEVGGLCTGAGSEMTLASGRAHVEPCGCTVWFSDSAWCDDAHVADGGSHPIEWVCDPQTELYDALNTHCTTMPTDAARWCCPMAFEPACLPQ